MLMLLSSKIDSGKMTISRVDQDESSSDVVFEWLQTYYDYLPKKVKPDREDLRLFSNYFASYLNTSFDLDENPGLRWNSVYKVTCRIENARRLRLNMGIRGKRKRKRLSEFSNWQKNMIWRFHQNLQRSLAHSPDTKRDASYSAYVHSLFERMQG